MSFLSVGIKKLLRYIYVIKEFGTLLGIGRKPKEFV